MARYIRYVAVVSFAVLLWTGVGDGLFLASPDAYAYPAYGFTPQPSATATSEPSATATTQPPDTATPEPRATLTPAPSATPTFEPPVTSTVQPPASPTAKPPEPGAPEPTASPTPVVVALLPETGHQRPLQWPGLLITGALVALSASMIFLAPRFKLQK